MKPAPLSCSNRWLLALALATAATLAHGQPPRDGRELPPHDHFRLEHPQHRLAYWYANESRRQASQAREMVCGFTGQHWTLDWDVHYRWALRTSPRRVYGRVEDRARHLSTCRSRKLHDYRDRPYRRDPGGRGQR